MWYENENYVKLKTDKVIVKLRDKEDNFFKSIIIPTSMYPLNDKYEVFSYKNTKQITDENVLSCFDSIEYKIGRCYDNTTRMTSALKEKGYNAVSYVGWIFAGYREFPVHHCWTVINRESVIDLADDFTVMLSGENGKQFEKADENKTKELLVSFVKAGKSVKNSQRCFPVGIPTQFFFYVGCPCEPEKGRDIYSKLMKKYPSHECEANCDKNGVNPTQQILAKHNLF